MTQEQWYFWWDTVESDYMQILDKIYFAKNSIRIMVPVPFRAVSDGLRPYFFDTVKINRLSAQTDLFLDYIKAAYAREVQESEVYDIP